jgi:GDP-mannose 4,6-dehydratase
MNKKVLITGITGMVGSHLTDYLLANTNHEIYGLARWRSPLDNISHLTSEINNGRITLIYGDLTDYISIIRAVSIVKPDFVYHLAAQSFPKTSFSEPILTFGVNINGTYNLLESIRQFSPNAKIHVCSSSEVFGRVKREHVPIKEDAPYHPASPYAISKIGTDLIGKYFADAYGMNTFITRMFTHTGPRRGDVFAESSFAKQIALIESDRIPPVVKVGNLNSLRTFADVRDAVVAYHKGMESNTEEGGFYNIGGNFSCTIGEMLEYQLKMSFRKNITIEVDSERLREIDADLQVPDTSKFQNLTGWEPTIKFEKTMNDLLEYWRNRVQDPKSAVIQR